MLHPGRLNAPPRVAHVDGHAPAVLFGPHGDLPLFGELHRVREQVQQYLLQALAVGRHRRDILARHAPQFQGLIAAKSPRQRHGPLEQIIQSYLLVEQVHATRPEPAEVQYPLHQQRQPPGAVPHQFQVFGVARRQFHRGVLKHAFRESHDAVQGRLQFVGGGRQELVFHFIQHHQAPVGLFQVPVHLGLA